MNRVMKWLLAASKRWWAVAGAILLMGAAFAILFGLEDQFQFLNGGTPVFDTQPVLTTAEVRAQLPYYTGDGLAAYLRFAAWDFVWPLVGAISQAILWTLFLRLNTWPPAGRLLRARLPLLTFSTTLFDYLENVGLLWVIADGGSETAVAFAMLFKTLKLFSLGALSLLLIASLIALIANVVTQLIARQQAMQRPVPSAPS